jgi:hypothetical protein
MQPATRLKSSGGYKNAFHPVRFGEALRIAQDHLDSKNFYAFNPEFDKKQATQLKK